MFLNLRHEGKGDETVWCEMAQLSPNIATYLPMLPLLRVPSFLAVSFHNCPSHSFEQHQTFQYVLRYPVSPLFCYNWQLLLHFASMQNHTNRALDHVRMRQTKLLISEQYVPKVYCLGSQWWPCIPIVESVPFDKTRSLIKNILQTLRWLLIPHCLVARLGRGGKGQGDGWGPQLNSHASALPALAFSNLGFCASETSRISGGKRSWGRNYTLRPGSTTTK